MAHMYILRRDDLSTDNSSMTLHRSCTDTTERTLPIEMHRSAADIPTEIFVWVVRVEAVVGGALQW